MKPIAYYSKSRDYVCTPEERTLLKLYKTYTVPLIPVQKPLTGEEILLLTEKNIIEKKCILSFVRAIEERHGIK